MTPLDLGIVAAYLLGVLVLSAWVASSQRSIEDYFVAGRRLPWWALAVSTAATQSSANSFIGIPAFVALVPGGGLTWLQYELAVPLAIGVVMAVFTPALRGRGVVSVYEYLQWRFDRPTRLLLSGVFLLSRAAATGVALYAAALVVEVITGLPLSVCVFLAGALTVLYDAMGGMRAVVWTDTVQMALMIAGIGICIGQALDIVGSWQSAWTAMEPARLRALDPASGWGEGSRAPLWGLVIGGFVLYVAYYGVDQTQVQRQLSAGSVPQARAVLAANALGRFPLTLAYVAMGVAIAAVHASDAALQAAIPPGRWDALVPRFIELHIPPGLRGLLVAAILAAAMSSLDSALNGLSAATMRDFIEPRVAAHRRLVAARLTTLAWGVVIVAVALHAGDLGSSVVETINRVGAMFYGPLLAAFACAVLDRRATGAGVRWGVAAGLGTNLLLWWTAGPAVFWMWWNVSGLVVAALTSALVSRATSPTGPGGHGTALEMPPQAPRMRAWWWALTAHTIAILACLIWLDSANAA